MKLRNDPAIRRQMKYARWDTEDAIKERHLGVKLLQRDRVRMAVKFCRFRLHRLMRDAASLNPP